MNKFKTYDIIYCIQNISYFEVDKKYVFLRYPEEDSPSYKININYWSNIATLTKDNQINHILLIANDVLHSYFLTEKEYLLKQKLDLIINE